MKLIESKTLGTAQASIEFTSIPQTFTDLVVLFSTRGNGSSNGNNGIQFNGVATNQSGRFLYGGGSSAASFTISTSGNQNIFGYGNNTNQTANTFSSGQFYIPNYTGATNKSVGVESAGENNGTNVSMNIAAGLWSSTAAITSLTLVPTNGSDLPEGTFVAGSIVSLYGILKGSDGIVTTS
jgi:hypothetical protein